MKLMKSGSINLFLKIDNLIIGNLLSKVDYMKLKAKYKNENKYILINQYIN